MIHHGRLTRVGLPTRQPKTMDYKIDVSAGSPRCRSTLTPMVLKVAIIRQIGVISYPYFRRTFILPLLICIGIHFPRAGAGVLGVLMQEFI